MRYLDEFEVKSFQKRSRLTFGEYLRKIRKRNGVTQEELAEQLNLNRTEISHYENGSRDISFSNFCVLSECFEFSLRDYEVDTTLPSTLNLFENAIYREIGRDKRDTIGYLTPSMDISHTIQSKRQEFIENELRQYFDESKAKDIREILILADMLYYKVSDGCCKNILIWYEKNARNFHCKFLVKSCDLRDYYV